MRVSTPDPVTLGLDADALQVLLDVDAAAAPDVLFDAHRLEAVLALGLHDPEQVQPRVAALLAQLAADLDVPVALLNGLLPGVQVLAGAHGLQGWLAEVRATPVEWSLCAQVVRTAAPRVVPDLAADPATSDNPLLVVDGLQAYAGVPLTARDGQVVGALCVLDHRPRTFTGEQVAHLQAVAGQALALLSRPRGAAEDALPR